MVNAIERLGTAAASLAEAVSLAVRIEPQLLRKARLDLFPGADAGVEADVWFSHIVESRAPSGIVLRQPAAQLLRERLSERPSDLDAAWRVVESVHKGISPALFAEERLAYLSLAGKHDEARDLLRSVVATLLSPRGRGLAGWAARAIQRLPDQARHSEEVQMLAFGASLRLADSALFDSGIDLQRATEWAAWLSPDELETAPFGVALLEDGVEFGPVGRSQSHRIELPRTTPILVELRWNDGTSERSERVALPPHKVSVIDIGPGVREVNLRTVLGDSYTLTVPAPRSRESVQQKLTRVRPPKVRITYDVEVGGAIEVKELPFVVGVLAGLSGHPAEPLPSLRRRKLVDINADNFDDVLAGMRPRLHFSVGNRIEADLDPRLSLDLQFQAFSDFEPVSLIRQITPLRELLDVRSRLSELRSCLVGNEQLVDLLEKTLLAPEPQGIDSMLLAVGRAANVGESRARELVSTLMNTVPAPRKAGELEGLIRDRIADIDSRLSAQLREVLHHPAFQALESTWRGLYYLVTQTEIGQNLRIRVWNVDKQELAQDFAEAGEFDQSAFFKRASEDEYGTFAGQPYGVFVGAYEFDRSPEDIDLLEKVSAVAGSVHAPFLAGASAGVLGLDSFVSLGALRDVKAFDGPDAALWNKFRDSDNARYAALTLPRILLRLPYSTDTNPVEEFDFNEGVDGSNHSLFLWGNAAFALAGRITNAFALYNWCAAIRGVEGGGLVEGLPVYTFNTDEGDVVLKCLTEIAITDRREYELSSEGFVPLVCVKDTDYAAFFSVQTVHRPRPYLDDRQTANARLASQLPYIFAVSRFAHYLRCMMRDSLGSFMLRAQVESFLNKWISNYVTADDSASQSVKASHPLREARIEVEEIEGRPGAYRCIAYLWPHFQLDELTTSLRIVVDLPPSAAQSFPPA